MKVAAEKLQDLSARLLKCRTRTQAIEIGAELALLFTAGMFRPSKLGDEFADAMCDITDARFAARKAAGEIK